MISVICHSIAVIIGSFIDKNIEEFKKNSPISTKLISVYLRLQNEPLPHILKRRLSLCGE